MTDVKIEYRSDLQNNYLVLEVPEISEEEDYGLRMVQQNRVKGLLQVHESGMDGKRYLNYEITFRQTLESLYEKKVMGYQDILFIFSGIYDTLEEMRKYLLSWQRLLFAPELIYVLPERRGLLLCYYAKEDEYPVTALAEFILKRLDHRDRQAVALGYGFYQQISEANFSLAKTLKEILAGARENGQGKHGSGRQAAPDGKGGAGAAWEYGRSAAPDDRGRAGAAWEYGKQSLPDGRGGTDAAWEYGRQAAPDDRNRPGAAWECGRQGLPDGRRVSDADEEPENEWMGWDHLENGKCDNSQPFAQKRSRKKKREKDLADWLFSKVHPVIMITFLCCMVVLEVLLVFGLLGIREAGGCFFLILSAEALMNRRILHKNKNETEEWEEENEEENEEEEYQKILQEVYQAEPEAEHEPLEETCYLNTEKEEEPLRLVCVSNENFPDIYPGEAPLYIGKIRGDADILLNVSTVSRIHARLEVREKACYLRDMNSKNGTFINGRRLLPQEECELGAEDSVAFAEVEYRVVAQR